MDTFNTKQMIRQAGTRLEGKNARSIALLHAGVTAGFALVVTLLQYMLSVGIGSTSGLSGMGTRSLLQTIQTVLQWANMIFAPFWNLGFLYVALLWAREKFARKEDLLTGFSRIGPVIGLLLARSVLVIAVVMICTNVSSAIFMMTPAAQPLTDLAMEMNMDMEAINQYLYGMTEAQMMDLLHMMLPLFVIAGALAILLLVPLLYRFRLAEYAILDQKGLRAIPAMILSAAMMRRRCWQLLKLDLRFWWYYGLKLLCVLLCYLDVLLPAMGLTLPFGGDGAYFATYVLYLAALVLVETAFRPLVETTYAGVYETLLTMGPAQKKTAPPKPQDMPWDAE